MADASVQPGGSSRVRGFISSFPKGQALPQGTTEVATQVTRPGNARPSVLIVDDERDLLHVVRLILDAEDFNVLPDASDGKQAVELARRYQPRFVVLDFMMPGQNGAEVAPLIRGVSPDSVIVAFSAGLHSRPEWADEFLGKQQIPQLAPLLERMTRVGVLG